MKKAIFSASIIAVLFTGSAFMPTNEQDIKASLITREMSAKIGINDSDYIKLKNINLEYLAKVAEVETAFKNDSNLRNSKLVEVQNTYETQLQSFLNKKQLEAYASYKESNSNFGVSVNNK